MHYAQSVGWKIVTNCHPLQSQKRSKKGVDNWETKCYNMQAVKERGTRAGRNRPPYGCAEPRERDEISRKKLKKLLENLLTKRKRCDTMGELLCEKQAPEKITKKVEKLLKNLLTNGKRCDIIVGHFRREARDEKS